MAASYAPLDPSFGTSVPITGDLSGITSSLVIFFVSVGVLCAIFFRFAPSLVGYMSGDSASKRSQAKDNFFAGLFGLSVIILLIPIAISINKTYQHWRHHIKQVETK